MDDNIQNIHIDSINDKTILITPTFIEVEYGVMITQSFSSIDILPINFGSFSIPNNRENVRFDYNGNFDISIVILKSTCRVIFGGNFINDIMLHIEKSDVDIIKRDTFSSNSFLLEIDDSDFKILSKDPPSYD